MRRKNILSGWEKTAGRVPGGQREALPGASAHALPLPAGTSVSGLARGKPAGMGTGMRPAGLEAGGEAVGSFAAIPEGGRAPSGGRKGRGGGIPPLCGQS